MGRVPANMGGVAMPWINLDPNAPQNDRQQDDETRWLDAWARARQAEIMGREPPNILSPAGMLNNLGMSMQAIQQGLGQIGTGLNQNANRITSQKMNAFPYQSQDRQEQMRQSGQTQRQQMSQDYGRDIFDRQAAGPSYINPDVLSDAPSRAARLAANARALNQRMALQPVELEEMRQTGETTRQGGRLDALAPLFSALGGAFSGGIGGGGGLGGFSTNYGAGINFGGDQQAPAPGAAQAGANFQRRANQRRLGSLPAPGQGYA